MGSQNGVTKGASHGIGHVLGGTAGVPHGYTSCVMLPPVLRFNEPVNAERQAWVSEALGRPGDAGRRRGGGSDCRALGLPGTLRAVGVQAEQLDPIAEESMHDRWVHTNPAQDRRAGGCAGTARCGLVSGAVQSSVDLLSSSISSVAAKRLAQDGNVRILVELRHPFRQAQIGVAEARGQDDLYRNPGQQDLVQHVDAVLLRHDHVQHQDVGLECYEGFGRLRPSC